LIGAKPPVRIYMAIVEYIADDNPDAAQELKDEIETKVSELVWFPHWFRCRVSPSLVKNVKIRNFVQREKDCST